MGLYVQQSRKRVFQGICVLAVVTSFVLPSVYGFVSSKVAHASDDSPVGAVDTEGPKIAVHKNSPDNGSIIDGDQTSTNGQSNKFEFVVTDNIPGTVKSVVVTMTNRKTKTATDFNPKQHAKNKDLWILALNPTSQLPDGTYDITVKATDIAGNETTQGNYFVIIDNNAPVGAITTPTDGAYVHNTVTLSGRIDDAAPSSYNFTITDDKGVVQADSGVLPQSATNSWSWDTTKLGQDGVYTVSFTAKDKLDRPSVPKTIKVTVDNTAPSTPTINAIDNTANPSRTIAGTAEPSATVAISLDTGATQTVPVDATGKWSATFDALGVQTYTATAYAIDKADNHSVNATASFQVQELIVKNPTNPTVPTGTTQPDDYKLEIKPELIVKGLIEPNQTKRSFSYGFNVSNATDDSLGASSLLDDDKSDQDVKGESIFGNDPESVAAVTPSTQGWKVLGIAWYWWTLALAGICLAIWQLSASIYHRLQKQEL